ncbi:hypothetical protein ACWDUL_20750 [Nocardia niigatensis]
MTAPHATTADVRASAHIGRPTISLALGMLCTFAAFGEYSIPAEGTTGRGVLTALTSTPTLSVVSYQAGFIIAALTVGHRLHLMGRNPMTYGLAAFSLASLAVAIGHTTTWFAQARALHGASAGVLMVTALAAIFTVASPERIIAYATVWYLLAAAAVAFGPVLLADAIGQWAWAPSSLLWTQAGTGVLLAALHETVAPVDNLQPFVVAGPIIPVLGYSAAAAATLLASPGLYMKTTAIVGALITIGVAALWAKSRSGDAAEVTDSNGGLGYRGDTRLRMGPRP